MSFGRHGKVVTFRVKSINFEAVGVKMIKKLSGEKSNCDECTSKKKTKTRNLGHEVKLVLRRVFGH